MGKIKHISHVLGVGDAEILLVVCVIGFECKSGLHVLNGGYVLVIKLLQMVSMC